MSDLPPGYADPAYAASLAEFGTPLTLPCSRGSLLVRPVPASDRYDAMGPYPLFACQHWAGLAADFEELELGGDLVSVTAVVDPFGAWTHAQLERAFPHRLVPFKEHFVVELEPDPLSRVTAHHRRSAARGARKVDAEVVAYPPALLDDWCGLYAELVRRHRIEEVAAFSREAFEWQLRMDGMVALRAREAERVVGAALWLRAGDVAYFHLAAYGERGHRLGASYALTALALEHFCDEGAAWLALGAGAGVRSGREDGLSRFKAGWATGTRMAWLGGRVLDPEAYAELVCGLNADYFPAYRAPSSG